MSVVTVEKLSEYSRVIDCMADKSISIRSVLFNAYATRESATVKNLLLSDDVLSAIDCVRRLGARVELDGTTAKIEGRGFRSAELDCGNSGTTARLLMGLLSGINGKYTLNGDVSLSSRPMKRCVEPLSLMNADIVDTNGRLPVTVRGRALKGIEYEMPVASAQVKSAIILAAVNAFGTTVIHEKIKSRDHTETMLHGMGADISVRGNTVTVNRSIVTATDFTVPGDISSAAFPICLALSIKGGRCVVKNVGINPTRTGILDVLKSCGANITLKNTHAGAEPRADICVEQSALMPFTIDSSIIPRLVDEIPVLCALACFIDGVSVVKGAQELRAKEADRIKATVAALGALGADITETQDGMIVRGGKPLHFGRVDSMFDHRIAMSAAIVGAAAQGVEILGGDCASVSYPGFYKEVTG